MSCVQAAASPWRSLARSRRKALDLSELKTDPFLPLKEGHCFRDSVIAACRQARLRPNVVFESGQFATILAMALAGMGVSAAPAMAVQPAPGCRFVRLAGKRNRRRIGIVKLRHHCETRAQHVLLERVREACGAGAAGLKTAHQYAGNRWL